MDTELLIPIRRLIEYELSKNIENICINTEKLCHNHPPLRRIVNGCKYCEKYGNIFVLSE